MCVAFVAVAAVAAARSSSIPTWLAVASLAAALVLAAILAFRFIPAFDPLGRVRWRLPAGRRDQKRCAITFDDGPSAETATVLDILAAEQVPATFFVLGGNAHRHQTLVQRAHAEGHAVGVHGMSHAKLAGARERAIEDQIGGTLALLRRLGVAEPSLYRTPHGFKSRRVLSVARRHGLTVWAWTRGVWDTDRPAPDVLVRRATRLARSGMVLLLHDGRGDEPQPDIQTMIAALPGILRELKQRGFNFVRLADV